MSGHDNIHERLKPAHSDTPGLRNGYIIEFSFSQLCSNLIDYCARTCCDPACCHTHDYSGVAVAILTHRCVLFHFVLNCGKFSQ
jgi:hypothetical protein